MSTPTQITAIETTAKTDVAVAKSWLLLHERLIVIVLLLAASLFIGNKFLSHVAEKDNAAAAQTQQVLQAQQATDKALIAQVAQQTQQYQALVVQLSQQNAQLAEASQQRTVVLQQQVAKDQTLPLPDLGNRWAQLASIKPSDINASTAGITVTPSGALSTVTQLEKVPVLESNVQDGQTQITNDTKELTASNSLIASQVVEIDGLKLTITDQDKACKTEVAAIKSTARKGKLKAFLYGAGVGAGIVTGLVIHALL